MALALEFTVAEIVARAAADKHDRTEAELAHIREIEADARAFIDGLFEVPRMAAVVEDDDDPGEDMAAVEDAGYYGEAA